MSMRPGCGKQGQRGQSLVEVCVACIALVPLAIGIVYIGQYIHIKQTVQQAAREAAWDAAVAPSTYRVAAPDSGAEQTRLRADFFGDADAPIPVTPASPHAFSDPLLVDYSGKTLLAPADVTIKVYTDEQTPGPEGAIDAILNRITGALGSALSSVGLSQGAGAFPPDAKGYLTAEVSAQTAKATRFDPFNTLDLNFRSRTVLLADAWNADGTGENPANGKPQSTGPIPLRSVRSVVTGLVPSTALLSGWVGDALQDIGDVIDIVPGFSGLFPGLDHIEPGKTAPDVVPYDKLQPYQQ